MTPRDRISILDTLPAGQPRFSCRTAGTLPRSGSRRDIFGGAASRARIGGANPWSIIHFSIQQALTLT